MFSFLFCLYSLFSIVKKPFTCYVLFIFTLFFYSLVDFLTNDVFSFFCFFFLSFFFYMFTCYCSFSCSRRCLNQSRGHFVRVRVFVVVWSCERDIKHYVFIKQVRRERAFCYWLIFACYVSFLLIRETIFKKNVIFYFFPFLSCCVSPKAIHFN